MAVEVMPSPSPRSSPAVAGRAGPGVLRVDEQPPPRFSPTVTLRSVGPAPHLASNTVELAGHDGQGMRAEELTLSAADGGFGWPSQSTAEELSLMV